MGIWSMTGYGRGEGLCQGRRLVVEIRGVNNRYLDVSVKLPRGYLPLEEPIKKAVGGRVSRGKVEVFVSAEGAGAEAMTVAVNLPLARSYYEALQTLGENLSLLAAPQLGEIARMPEVLSLVRQEEDSEARQTEIMHIVQTALEDFVAMRSREGENLRQDIAGRVLALRAQLQTVEKQAPLLSEGYRNRLRQRMEEVLGERSVDEGRLLTEVALYADKVAVDEETVRLGSHLEQLESLLAQGGVLGRKLDFLIQELNREVNTIGSKCSDVALAQVVVEMKSEIEKMREQVQNIE